MPEATEQRIVYDEATLKQLEDDDPGISWIDTVRQTLPLVRGVRGKARALFMAALRLLP